MTGKVYLVGAGPGDPELLTLKALKLLKSADVVLHDDLIGPEILAFVPSSTEVQNVGKRFGEKKISQVEINALLVQNALLGLPGGASEEWRPPDLRPRWRRNRSSAQGRHRI